jgi:hypothetical protein
VQEGTSSYRAGLVIKGPVDIDNLCTCRAAREAGIICAHSVAVGLHHLLVRGAPRGARPVTRTTRGQAHRPRAGAQPGKTQARRQR